MRRALAIAAACTLAACNQHVSQTKTTEKQEIYTPFELTGAQRKAVEAGVRESLKDPESARFGTVKAGKDSQGVMVVCGLVNAKNSYGGYTGQTAFQGVLTKSGTFVVAAIDRTDLPASAVMCRDSGLDVLAKN